MHLPSFAISLFHSRSPIYSCIYAGEFYDVPKGCIKGQDYTHFALLRFSMCVYCVYLVYTSSVHILCKRPLKQQFCRGNKKGEKIKKVGQLQNGMIYLSSSHLLFSGAFSNQVNGGSIYYVVVLVKNDRVYCAMSVLSGGNHCCWCLY